MRTLFILFLSVSLASCTSKKSPSEVPSLPPETATASPSTPENRSLHFQTLKWASDGGKNLVVSPIGVRMIFEALEPYASESIKKILSSSLGPAPAPLPEVTLSTSLWAQKASAPTGLTPIRPLVLAEVNAWVNEVTKGVLPKAFASLDPKLPFLALSALSFKGAWKYPFDPKITELGHFQSSLHAMSTVKMMKQLKRFRFGEDARAKWIDLPYANSKLVLTLILPLERFGLSALESSLNEAALTEALAKMSDAQVELVLPRVRIQDHQNLRSALSASGLGGLFAQGEWKAISKNPEFRLGEILQINSFELNEEGTVGASVTAGGFETTSVVMGLKKTFIADQPFLFLLRNPETGDIPFMGKISEVPGLAP